jgi:hypothetical protein
VLDAHDQVDLLLLLQQQRTLGLIPRALLALQAFIRIRSAFQDLHHLQIRQKGPAGALWRELRTAVSRCPRSRCCCCGQ